MNKVTEFTIDRSKWRRGKLGEGHSELLNEQGFQCCLGFYSKACGLPIAEQLGTSLVNQIRILPKQMDWLLEKENRLEWMQTTFIKINDSDTLTESEREAKISDLFATQGIRVNFIN